MKRKNRRPLAIVTVSLLPVVLASCAGAASGSGADPSGAYQYTLEGLYTGMGSLSISAVDGECTGWATLPGSGGGVELERCRVSKNGVSLVFRPLAGSGLDIVISAKVAGRNLEGRWSTEGRSGRFTARSERW